MSNECKKDGRDGRGDEAAVRNDDRSEARKVSAKARARQTLAGRHDSPESYARFAVDAAFDLFDGEPIEIYREVGRLDATHQRKVEHRLRREQFSYLLANHPNAMPKALTA